MWGSPGKAFTAGSVIKRDSRYGTAITPMDDALTLVALDLSGRPYLGFDVAIPAPSVGQFDTELVEEFFRALPTMPRPPFTSASSQAATAIILSNQSSKVLVGP